jgi:hypothetical protein
MYSEELMTTTHKFSVAAYDIYNYRDFTVELVEDGNLDPSMALVMCLKYMSQDEVKDMLEINDLLTPEAGDDFCEACEDGTCAELGQN